MLSKNTSICLSRNWPRIPHSCNVFPPLARGSRIKGGWEGGNIFTDEFVKYLRNPFIHWVSARLTLPPLTASIPRLYRPLSLLLQGVVEAKAKTSRKQKKEKKNRTKKVNFLVLSNGGFFGQITLKGPILFPTADVSRSCATGDFICRI